MLVMVMVVVHVKMKKDADLNENKSLEMTITKIARFVIYIVVTLLRGGYLKDTDRLNI
jgi:hypothetical protein